MIDGVLIIILMSNVVSSKLSLEESKHPYKCLVQMPFQSTFACARDCFQFEVVVFWVFSGEAVVWDVHI
jgi:hypothetical protein